ncbi:hypothetical protein BJX66DRAFT_337596 [Aspergillus keveii]|uniref:Carrier domain-containing protein n=1 Tax=Aspergillus keveii TaxID=714993 RepID=A0ABR4G731_9EURO
MSESKITPDDLAKVWVWNSTVPSPVNRCLHETFMEKAQQQPAAPAICAWDGELTYEELDSLSSRLAQRLISLGVCNGVIVPLCFEKSRWMSVAAIAVLKAGGACVALDISLPRERLQTIVQQSQPTPLILCSANREHLAGQLHSGSMGITLPVDSARIHELPARPHTDLPVTDPSSAALVIFTSGTTGTPKGIVLSHTNVSSAMSSMRSSLPHKKYSRIFDFAPYSFDAAWDNLFKALTWGGCLCIPSESARVNHLARAINDLHATAVLLTPSAATMVTPSDVPSLQVLMLGGEPIPPWAVATWAEHVDLFNAYGPAECSIIATIAALSDERTRSTGELGMPAGQVLWVVSEAGDELVPIGSVGELWVEGHMVGVGYLQRPELTASSFVSDPVWLTRGVPGVHPGRSGRLYRTGDLVRCCHDGSLSYIGRRDKQVKIRGRRVDLGGIERDIQVELGKHEWSRGISVAVEMVVPHDGETAVAVAFVGIGKRKEMQSYISRVRAHAEDALHTQFTQGILPVAYFPIDVFPKTATDKTDRRRLCEMAAALDLGELVQLSLLYDSPKPMTDTEHLLRSLWAAVIGLDAESISTGHSFIHVGGDSVNAMRLVALADEQGLTLTVADVLGSANLSDLAQLVSVQKKLERRDKLGYQPPAPFSLLDTVTDAASVAALLKTPADQVCDAYPATFIQRLHVGAGAREYFYMRFPPGVADITRIESAVLHLWKHFGMLRTVFVEENNGDLLQVVLDPTFPLPLQILKADTADLTAFSDKIYHSDLNHPLEPNRPVTRFILTYRDDGQARLCIRLSHAQYDGSSFPILCASFSAFYHGEIPPPAVDFSGYIRKMFELREPATRYWSTLLQGSQRTRLRPLAAVSGQKETHETLLDAPITLKRTFPAPKQLPGYTKSTVFTACVAQALATTTGETDITFGLMVSGRASLALALQSTFGPCSSVPPIRVRVGQKNKNKTKTTLPAIAQSIHNQTITGQRYEIPFGGLALLNSCAPDWPQPFFGVSVNIVNVEESPQVPGMKGEGTVLRQWNEDSAPILEDHILVTARLLERAWEVEVLGNLRYYSEAGLGVFLDSLEGVVAGVGA